MSQSLANICVHIVFGTKNRKPLITDDVRGRLHEYMSGALRAIGCGAIAINSVEDHAHILIHLARTVPLSKAVEHVKKTSSKWIKGRGAEFANFAWQDGYGAFSVSESNVGEVRKYIAAQRERHRKISFEDEYRELLTRHGVEFDEKYLWG